MKMHSKMTLEILRYAYMVLRVVSISALAISVLSSEYRLLFIGILVVSGILWPLGRLAYDNLRTCPRCQRKIEYEEAIICKESQLLYCPYCGREFEGKILE